MARLLPGSFGAPHQSRQISPFRSPGSGSIAVARKPIEQLSEEEQLANRITSSIPEVVAYRPGALRAIAGYIDRILRSARR